MKKLIYTVLALSIMSIGLVTANSLISTDHNHNTATSSIVIDHSGRTNKDGCHNDRKRGTYHCH